MESIETILGQNSFLKCHLDQSFENLSSFSQNLYRNTSCLDYILEILRNAVNMEHKVKLMSSPDSPSALIHLILAESCVGNDKNKELISGLVNSLFLDSLAVDAYPSNVPILLNKLAQDNKTIVLNSGISAKIVTRLFDNLEKVTPNFYRVAYSLNTIQQFVFCGEISIRQNQNLIISNLISSNYHKVFSRLYTHNLINTLREDLSLENYQFEYRGMKVECLTPELCFDLAYFEIVSICSFDKNAFAENIAQSLITQENLENIFLKLNSNNPQFNYEAGKFLFHAYIETEKVYTPKTQIFLFGIIGRVLKILISGIESINQGLPTRYLLTYKEVVTIEEIYVDLCQVMLDNIKVFITQMSKTTNSKIDPIMLSKFLNEAYNSIEDKTKFIKNKTLEKMIYDTLKAITIVNKNSKHFIIERLQKKRKTVKEQMESEGILTRQAHEEELNMGFRTMQLMTIFRKKNIITKFKKEKETSRSAKFADMVKNFLRSKEYQNLTNEEFGKLVHRSTDKKSKKHFEDFLVGLVNYMNPENGVNKDIISIGLKIFSEYVDGEVDENTPTETRIRILKLKQDFLIDIEVVELICKIINCCGDDDSIFDLAVQVCIKILNEGNVKAQNEFLRVMIKIEDQKTLFNIERITKIKFSALMKRMNSLNSYTLQKIIFGRKSFGTESQEFVGFEQENRSCIQIFRFMQLLCEGHNSALQNYLRIQHQEDNIDAHLSKNVNFVGTCVGLFGSYIKFFNKKCSDFGEMQLDFMIEAVQGPCRGNQDMMISCKLVDYCKDFLNDLNASEADLKAKRFSSEKDPILDSLFTKTITLLLSLLEANNEPKVIRSIGLSVDFDFLKKKLVRIYEGFCADLKAKPSFDYYKLLNMMRSSTFGFEMIEGFEVYFFIQTINDCQGAYRSFISAMKEHEERAYNFFKENSGHIEIIFQDRLQRIYFIKHPACNYLAEEEKDSLMNTVRRDNPTEKISDFMKATPNFFSSMDHLFRLAKRWKIKPVYQEKVRNTALVISFMINIYMFVSFEKKIVNNRAYDHDRFYPPIMTILGVSHTCCGLILIFLQFIIGSKIILAKAWREKLDLLQKRILREMNEQDKETQIVLALLDKDFGDLSVRDVTKILSYERSLDGVTDKNLMLSGFTYQCYNLVFLLSDFNLIYFMFYAACSFFALLLNVNILYSLSLFEIIVRKN